MIQRGEIGFDARGGAVHDGVGVEGSHATVRIDEVDDLVQVLVPAAPVSQNKTRTQGCSRQRMHAPQPRVAVVKVTAHEEHDVGALRPLAVLFSSLHESVDQVPA